MPAWFHDPGIAHGNINVKTIAAEMINLALTTEFGIRDAARGSVADETIDIANEGPAPNFDDDIIPF